MLWIKRKSVLVFYSFLLKKSQKMIVSKELIARIMASFLLIAQKDNNRFHPKDVQMVRTKSWWSERFVLISESEGEALKALVNTMEWRKLNGINDIKLEELEEAVKLGKYYQI